MRYQELNGRKVSDEMYQDARIISKVGGRMFLVVGEQMAAGCSNCNGNGFLHLQTIAGGPYEYVPTSISDDKNHKVPAFIDGAWYHVKIKGYPCPVCGGEQIVSEIDERITNAALFDAAEKMQTKSNYRQGQRQLERQAKTMGRYAGQSFGD